MQSLAELIDMADAYEQALPPAPPLPQPPVGAEIAGWIDHTLLKPEATAEQIKKLCDEARQYGFASVCVNPAFTSLAAGLLSGTSVKVCTVVGFPLGATLPTYKALEALSCLSAGAVELDMVIHIGALKGGAYGQVLNDIIAVTQVAHNQRAIVKVILEMALLSRREKIIACLISKAAGADFVKTSTGFGPGGATVEDVDLMFRLVGPTVQVKAAGGIRDLQTAQAMIAAGATRLGSSSGVQIVQEASA
jgi:deoxyribose-phosphate aldolase